MIILTFSVCFLLLQLSIAKNSLLNLVQVFLYCLVHFGEKKRCQQVSDAQGDHLAFIVALSLLYVILRLLLFLAFALIITGLYSLHGWFDREIEIAD